MTHYIKRYFIVSFVLPYLYYHCIFSNCMTVSKQAHSLLTVSTYVAINDERFIVVNFITQLLAAAACIGP